MKEEIVAGLRNAMERGYSLEQAIQSFINAGYNPLDVREAANVFESVSHIVYSSEENKAPVEGQENQVQLNPSQYAKQVDSTMLSSPSPLPQQGNKHVNKPKSELSTWLVVTQIIVLLLLVGVLIGTMMFKQQILAFFKGM